MVGSENCPRVCASDLVVFCRWTKDATLTFHTEKQKPKRGNQTESNLAAELKNEIWGTMAEFKDPNRRIGVIQASSAPKPTHERMRMASTVKKLGLKPGMRALVLGAPSGYMNSLAPLPDRVEVSQSLGSPHQFIQFFATKKSDIEKSAKKLLQSASPGALVWITYPKKTSGVDSDLSREAVWAAMEETGWRPVSQIAIDEVWSALRFRPTQDVKSRE